MGTRCQVEVHGPEESLFLYHHWDGYPENMVKLFNEAYVLAVGPVGGDLLRHEAWRAGRVGKIASFLCASDPGAFEPEDHKELHNDIEWFYRINPTIRGFVDSPAPQWELEVWQRVGEWDFNKRLVCPSDDFKLAYPKQTIQEVWKLVQAKGIEILNQ